MSDKSLNSLLGSLATKELPASGRLKTSRNSIDQYHDKESFHSKLMNSMEESERYTRRDSKDIPSKTNSMKQTKRHEEQVSNTTPSETNAIKKIQKHDKQTDTNITSETNSMKQTQKSNEQTDTDITSETNSINNSQKPDEQTGINIPKDLISVMDTNTQEPTKQTATDIPTEPTGAKTPDDIMAKLLSLELKTNQPGSTNGGQTQLNAVVNKGMNEDEITNAIINKIANQKTSTTQKVISTLPENNLLNNQDLKPSGETISNSAQKQTGDLIPEHATTLSGKPGTTQVTTNITQQVPANMEQDQLQTPLSDKLSTTQANTKVTEQKVLDILSNSGLSETATKSNGEGSILQQSKLSDRQATAPSVIGTDNNQSKTNTKESLNPVPTTQKADLNPISGAQKITDSKILDPNTLSNASPRTDEIDNSKINEMLKEQHQNKALASNAGKHPETQQSLTQAQIEGEETPKIFETGANTAESKAVKPSENATLTSSSNIKPVESAMQSNTSSDNSAFNNQRANTDFDYSSNTVNNSSKTKLDTNFTNTLSQINNSAKPLGTLGNDVADSITQSAKLFTQGGKSEVKVQLSPPELGNIKLQFKIENDVLETKITVERSSIKDVIEKDIPRLRELISNADIDVGKLDVSLQDKDNNKMDFLNKEFHSNSKNSNTKNSSQQDNEYHEDNLDEESVSNNTESTQINYLV